MTQPLDHASILAKVRRRIGSDGQEDTRIHGWPPASTEAVARGERDFGFVLPSFLKLIYLRIGNGGFGPGFGLLGLDGGMRDDTGRNCLELYHAYRSPVPAYGGWRWPEGLLPLCHWGCGVYACVECVDSRFTMTTYDPSAHRISNPDSTGFVRDSRTFDAWMNDWADGSDDETLFFPGVDL